MSIALSRAFRCGIAGASLSLAANAQADLLEGLQDLLSGHHEWEGAIGAVAGYGPAYLAAEDYSAGIKPALFLRYGRFSLNTGAGFTTRRADQMLRGLGVDLVVDESVKVTLSGRLDNGRSESSSPALAGMGDVDGSIRIRVTGTWRLDEGWKLGAAASIDALGRGQGTLGELSFVREHALTPDLLWSWGGSLSFGDKTYMQTYYGVTPEQSANSGYPVYTPSMGLRDMALSTGLIAELPQDWVGFVNIGVSQALGPVKDSPLSFKPLGYGINAGLAWRF
jgi:outer membrane scaffolding protein for murein synthesis (MipA/OmpV family)